MTSRAAAIAALQRLRAEGFGGRRILGDRGRTCTLHYRRSWRGVSDVVLVFGEDDAEAYRADDSIDDANPFEIASRRDLQEEVVGTVLDVVTAVLSWPTPTSWPSHYPSTWASDGHTSRPSGAHSAPG